MNAKTKATQANNAKNLRRRAGQVGALSACAALAIAGCSLFGGDNSKSDDHGPSATASGSATATGGPSVGTALVTPEQANSLILSKDDIGELLGTTMEYESKGSTPPDGYSVDAKQLCRSLAASLTFDIGDKWTTYRNVKYREKKDEYSHAVNQRVLLYSAPDDAQTVFETEFPADIKNCTGEIYKEDDTVWKVTVLDAADDHVNWRIELLVDDQPTSWRCAQEARLANNVLLNATVCQYGNGGPTAKAIMDRMVKGTQPK